MSSAPRATRAARRKGGRSGKKPARRLGPRRAVVVSVLLLAFGGGIFAARAVLRLDEVVRARFEGRLFTVPTRVYSAPTMLAAGFDVEQTDLRGTLERLGYREERDAGATPVAAPGSYRIERGRALLHLRPFEHPSRPEPARRVEIRLESAQIAAIRDLESGRELAAALLEPELVGAYYGRDHQQRELVRLGAVPRHLVDAVLAVEDQRFEQHVGIDWVRVLGAFWANLQAGEITQGGSTLTQQLVKNFFLTPERTFARKLQEAVMAVLVEARYEKSAILEAYLNEIYLGQRDSTALHGVGEAARFYFGKPVRSLRLEESALLAGLIRSPGRVNPFRDRDRALERRNLVLDLMREQGRIDAATHQAARAEPLALAPPTREPRDTRWFLDALRLQLPEIYDRDVLATAGLRIHSTLDLRLQRHAAHAVREGLEALEKAYPELRPTEERRLQACLVALRPHTGEVVALVGGRDYGESQFDRCTQARRPAGSAFKPFVYVAALEPHDGQALATLATLVDDAPLAVATGSGTWRPVNYDHRFHGLVSLREALERSLNVATARLAQEVGIPAVVETARRLGITSPLPAVPSLALGAADVTPLELARAYATLASGGVRPEVRLFEDVTDEAGRMLERTEADSERTLDPATAFLAVSMLEGVVDRGTARALRAAGLRGPVAGKTGTTDESKDLWFAGFTPELVAVVWVGYDQPHPMKHPASRIAVPIWQRFILGATNGLVRGSFTPPAGIVVAAVDPVSGALALEDCPRRQPEYFIAGTEPRVVCPSDGWQVFAGGREPGSSADGKSRREHEPGVWFGRFLGRLFGGGRE
jgi:penicillin-binding protein 1B